jgi:acyl-CoA thioester hydrolase
MEYLKEYQVKEEHIDVQGIMDGLYYPFYMEDCRHKFIKEIMGFDIEEKAKEGINMVLAGYTIKFFRPLRKNDVFRVNCSLYKGAANSVKFYLKQSITLNNKVFTEATFTVTCVPANGGKAYLPNDIKDLVDLAFELENPKM